MASICGPLRALPFSRPRCAPEGYTQGRDLEVWQRGNLVPLSIYQTQLEFLKRNTSGYVCNPGSSKEGDAASRCHNSCIPASILLHSLKLTPAASHMLLYQLVITSPRPWPLTHHLDWLHTIFRAAHVGDVPQSVYQKQRRLSSKNQGYICNLRRYILKVTKNRLNHHHHSTSPWPIR